MIQSMIRLPDLLWGQIDFDSFSNWIIANYLPCLNIENALYMATYSSTQAIKSKSTNLPSTSAIEPKKTCQINKSIIITLLLY